MSATQNFAEAFAVPANSVIESCAVFADSVSHAVDCLVPYFEPVPSPLKVIRKSELAVGIA